MTVSWNKESYDKVKQYNLYVLVGGHEMFLGGIYDENYYIKNVKEAIAEAAANHRAHHQNRRDHRSGHHPPRQVLQAL